MLFKNLWTGGKEKHEEVVQTIRCDDDYLLSIPHGGVLVPDGYENKLRLGRHNWMGTDPHTMELYASDSGTTVRLLISPNCVNTNRDRTPIEEKDPDLPDHLKKDPLHSNSLLGPRMLLEEPTDDEKELLFGYYDDYRAALARELERLKDANGAVFMLDCHSLNSVGLANVPDAGQERDDFVVGTNEGTSASKEVIDAFVNTLTEKASEHGWTVAVDDPYKGGSITRTYGKPENGWHVLQLETKRALYMNEALDEDDPDPFEYREEDAKKVNEVVMAAVRAAAGALKE